MTATSWTDCAIQPGDLIQRRIQKHNFNPTTLIPVGFVSNATPEDSDDSFQLGVPTFRRER